MSARICLIYFALIASARVSVGSIRLFILVPCEITGRSFSCNAKIYESTSATKKFGRELPINDRAFIILSNTEFFFTAESIPSGREIIRVVSKELILSKRVFGSLEKI